MGFRKDAFIFKELKCKKQYCKNGQGRYARQSCKRMIFVESLMKKVIRRRAETTYLQGNAA